uniref:Uncharacterized protein n=1 Tax=Arundo donax TaxID=35708 RepID=A0A0A9BSX3_ARUDO
MALNRASASGLDAGGCLSGCHCRARLLYAALTPCGEASLATCRIS